MPAIDFRSLKTLPVDIRKIIVREQGKEKENRGIQFSISSTIIKIIREWEKCKQ